MWPTGGHGWGPPGGGVLPTASDRHGDVAGESVGALGTGFPLVGGEGELPGDSLPLREMAPN